MGILNRLFGRREKPPGNQLAPALGDEKASEETCSGCGYDPRGPAYPLAVSIPCKCGGQVGVRWSDVDKVRGVMVLHSACQRTLYVPPTVWCPVCRQNFVPDWLSLVVRERPGEVAYEMTSPNLRAMRQLARRLIEQHGDLVEVRCVSGHHPCHIELLFASGHQIHVGEHSGQVDITMLKFGYAGAGPDCFRAFLDEAGFHLSPEQIATMQPGSGLRR